MRALLAEVSVRWRSRVGAILDHGVELCFSAGHRLLSLRERIDPTDADLTRARADRILTGVIAGIQTPPLFHPSDLDLAAAGLASEIQRTVWVSRHPLGVCCAAEHRAVHRVGRA
jgi:hypothetical protein